MDWFFANILIALFSFSPATFCPFFIIMVYIVLKFWNVFSMILRKIVNIANFIQTIELLDVVIH